VSRITNCLSQLSLKGKKALIPYIVCGDPDVDFTERLMHTLVDAGADIIELGVPFSDPMAEGPTIQKAHERALDKNMSLVQVLNVVSKFRANNTYTPIVLMGYANPIEKMGYSIFAQKAEQAGVDGVLTVDLPFDEILTFDQTLKNHHLDNVLLVTPTTHIDRVKDICEAVTGYLYYVSLKGVTGASHIDIVDVENNFNRIKQFSNVPVCVGFGIRDCESAVQIASFSDGIVIGSALIDFINENSETTEGKLIQARKWLQAFRDAIDHKSDKK
jgi:tryptophan synthase alpha chain